MHVSLATEEPGAWYLFLCDLTMFGQRPIERQFSLHVGVKFVRHVGVPEVAVSLMAGGE